MRPRHLFVSVALNFNVTPRDPVNGKAICTMTINFVTISIRCSTGLKFCFVLPRVDTQLFRNFRVSVAHWALSNLKIHVEDTLLFYWSMKYNLKVHGLTKLWHKFRISVHPISIKNYRLKNSAGNKLFEKFVFIMFEASYK